MSNPVVFFDMEIGGQPAGRIEMTVRIVFLFSFFSRVFLSSRARRVSLFSLDCDDEKFLDHFFPINPAGKKRPTTTTIRFLFHFGESADDLWWSSSSFFFRERRRKQHKQRTNNKSSERTCARKPRKTSVSYAPGNPGLGSSNRRFTG